MTCTTGDQSCDTKRRHGALLVLGLLAVIFLFLSFISFTKERGQVLPLEIAYKTFDADEGKRIFQAYNCMGCHTIVGNGAYLGPDLTKTYQQVGPAWLEAFLPSAGSWPTEALVKTQLLSEEQLALADVKDFTDYLNKYPAVLERIERRGGQATHMPNLQFRENEVAKLIAFLKYTSAMNNEGWPPEIKTGDLNQRLALAYGKAIPTSLVMEGSALDRASLMTGEGNLTPQDLITQGEGLTQSLGCLACHATDNSIKIGPGWGGLYNHEVTLDDGRSVIADEEYLKESILDPNAKIVEGYAQGTMPAYGSLVDEEELEAIIAYFISLTDSD